MRLNRILTFWWLCMVFPLCIEADEIHPSEKPHVTGWLTDVQKDANVVEFVYRINNSTDRDIWVCRGDTWYQTYPIFESEVVKEKGTLVLKIKSFIVPGNIYSSDPICAKYQKISSGRSADFRVPVEFPLVESTPLGLKSGFLMRDFYPHKSPEMRTLAFDELEILELEIGFYAREAFDDSVYSQEGRIDDTMTLCCYWAEKHPESTLSFQVERDTIDAYLEEAAEPADERLF